MIDWHSLQTRAQDLGYDCVAALATTNAKEALYQHHERCGADITAALEELASTQTVVMASFPFATILDYPAGVAHVSGYYDASQRSYAASIELAALAGGNIARALPLKPLGVAAGLGAYGRNGILVRQGSHMALAAILLPHALPEALASAQPMPCEQCGRCEAACPTGALCGQGRVERALCLRSHMNGEEVPPALAPLMGERLLGCDICLNACPSKAHMPLPTGWEELFAWNNLLDEQTFQKNLPRIEAAIGKNFARRLRATALRMQEIRDKGAVHS